jgi:hypothetical protein
MIRVIRWALAILLLGVASEARAQVISYVANLSGPAEEPPNNSPGTGLGQVDYNPTTHLMRVRINFTGLVGNTTASHIHAATPTPGSGTAGVATTTPTFAGFPLGVTFGTYDNTLDMTQATSYNPAYITANGGTTTSAEAALALAMSTGRAYLNVHSSTFPGGEIRGFLSPVPEPTSLALTGIAGLAALRFARQRLRQVPQHA